MNIWIIEKNSGITLLYQSFLKINVDKDLISGLLTAFNQFTVSEFKQPLESIEMGGLRWIYISDIEYNLLFVVADLKTESTEILRSKLMIIKDTFIRNYEYIWLERNQSWVGDINVFLRFQEQIESYYYDWEDAELITNISNFFEILGIFQNLLNLIIKSIEQELEGEIKEEVLENLKILFQLFKNQKEIRNDLELKNLTFSRELGFNVIDINPTNCDPIIVRKSITYLIIKIVDVIKEKIGVDACLKHFRKAKIFDYILNNAGLLKEFNLEIFFMRLFLLID